MTREERWVGVPSYELYHLLDEQDWGEAVEQEAKGRRESEFVEVDHKILIQAGGIDDKI